MFNSPKSKGNLALRNNIQPSELTSTEAHRMLDKSLAVISEMRPQRPVWLNENQSNAKAPLNYHKTSQIIDGFSMSAIYPGILGGLVGLFGSGVIKTIGELNFASLANMSDSDSYNLVLNLLNDNLSGAWGITVAGVFMVIGLTCKTLLFLASNYGGSKTRQPIRKKLAHMRYSEQQLQELERKVQEFEDYQSALQLHQMVIDKERERLERYKVLEILSSGDMMHSLTAEGEHVVKRKPEAPKVGEYDQLARAMVNHLKG